MSIRKIRILGDPVLRVPAGEVEVFDDDLVQLAEDMLETMYRSQGVGLAAPQIGISTRVLVIDVGESDEDDVGPIALVNPQVVEFSRTTDRVAEGCLSIPGMEEVVERPDAVTVTGFTPEGEPVTYELSGLISRVMQHEIDHLDGVLFIDRLSPLKRRILLKKWRKSQAEEVDS